MCIYQYLIPLHRGPCDLNNCLSLISDATSINWQLHRGHEHGHGHGYQHEHARGKGNIGHQPADCLSVTLVSASQDSNRLSRSCTMVSVPKRRWTPTLAHELPNHVNSIRLLESNATVHICPCMAKVHLTCTLNPAILIIYTPYNKPFQLIIHITWVTYHIFIMSNRVCIAGAPGGGLPDDACGDYRTRSIRAPTD